MAISARMYAFLFSALVSAFATKVAFAQDLASYGTINNQPITLMFPVVPSALDGKGKPSPAWDNWLSYIAITAEVNLHIHPIANSPRVEDVMKQPDACSIGYARLPYRELDVHWILEIKHDRMVFVVRRSDPFQGSLADLLKEANGHLGAPSGIYRNILESRGIKHVVIDDHSKLARMVEKGEPRFGLLIGGSLDTPDIKAMSIRPVAELPNVGFWFACSRTMPSDILKRITAAATSKTSERLHHEAIRSLQPSLASNH